MSTPTSDAVLSALQVELHAWRGHKPQLRGGLEKLSGGESSQCFGFELAEAFSGVPRFLVLRLTQDDRSAAREVAIQRAVYKEDFPVPAIFHAGTSVSAFGRPYAIMERVVGRDPVRDGAVRRVPDILGTAMARLHTLPTERLRAAVAAQGISVGEVEVARVLEDVARDGWAGRSTRWFERNSVLSGARVLCHGDLHPRNLLLNRGVLTAMVDWEIAVFAPREYDVARTELLLLLMPGVGRTVLRPLVRLLGQRAAARFVDGYRAHAPIDETMLHRCRALHVLRLIALLRSGDGAEGVRRMWQPFAATLARRWMQLTGERA